MITEQQFKAAAITLKCDVPAIRVVYEIEAAGRGYLTDGRVKILFEGHRFWKQLAKAGITLPVLKQAAAANPNVLYQVWNSKQYKGGAAEWDRMSQAITICKELNVPPVLALNSASYGSFQIMGENCKACGYPDAQSMLAAYNNGGEAEQLYSFVRFLQNTGLQDELTTHNWAGFAAGYNGTGYKLNHYDTKMAKLWSEFTGA